jgi:hypothetical protein
MPTPGTSFIFQDLAEHVSGFVVEAQRGRAFEESLARSRQTPGRKVLGFTVQPSEDHGEALQEHRPVF